MIPTAPPVLPYCGKKRQTVCKPGSVFPPDLSVRKDGHSSRRAITGALKQPTRTAGREDPPAQKRRAVPIRSCSRRGLPCPPRRRDGGALLPHLFTLTPQIRGGSFSVALSLRSPWPDAIRRLVFTEPGLSSASQSPTRPSDRLAMFICGFKDLRSSPEQTVENRRNSEPMRLRTGKTGTARRGAGWRRLRPPRSGCPPRH